MTDEYSMFVVGDRVAIDNGTKNGVLRYLGTTKFRPGVWAGIELDMPQGKHDGVVDGERYFTCAPNHGIFVHPSKLIHVGGGPTIRSQPNVFGPIGATSHPATSARISTVPAVTEAPVTPNRKKSVPLTGKPAGVSLPSQLPKSAPASSYLPPSMMSVPPTITSSNKQRSRQPETIVSPAAASLPEMEAELRKRQGEVAHAKAAMDALRLQISGVANPSEFLVTRDQLLSALDNYERVLARHDRQLKRVSVMKVQEERAKMSQSTADAGFVVVEGGNPSGISDQRFQEREAEYQRERERLVREKSDLLQKIEKTQKACDRLEDTLKNVEQEYDLVANERDSLRKQLLQQSATIAEMNRDRTLLRKELAETRQKLSTIASNDSFLADNNAAYEAQIQSLKEDNDRLSQEIAAKVRDIAQLRAEKEVMENRSNQLVSRQVEEMEDLAQETKETIQQLQSQLKSRDETITALQRQSSSHAKWSEEVEALRREKDAALAQVEELQRRLTDMEDLPELEAKHRAQLEAVRKTLNENWKKFTAELEEKDRLILELRSKAHPISGDGNELDLKRQLQDLSFRYEALLKAKETEGAYFSSKASKWGDEEMDRIMRERDEMRQEYQDQINRLTGRIERLMAERDSLYQNSQLRRHNSPDTEALYRQIDDLQRERNSLHEALAREAEASKAIKEEVERYHQKLIHLEKILDERTDAAATFEERFKTNNQQMSISSKAYESLQREHHAKVNMLETELAILRKSKESADSLAASLKRVEGEKHRFEVEKKRLEEELSDLQHQLTSINQLTVNPLKEENERIRSQLMIKSKSLIETEARLKVMEEQVSILPQKVAEQTRIYQEEAQSWRRMVEDLSRTGDAATQWNLQLDRLNQVKDRLHNQVAGQQAIIEELESALKRKGDDLAMLEGKLIEKENEIVSLQGRFIDQHSHLPPSQGQGDDEDLRTKVRLLEVERDRLFNDLSRFKEENDSLRAQLTSNQQSLSNTEGLVDQVQRLQKEIEVLNQTCQYRSEMLDLADKELNDLQAEMNNKSKLEDQYEALLRQHESTKKELMAVRSRLENGDSAPAPDTVNADMKRERDQLVEEKRRLERAIAQIEYEKSLLEGELASVKESLNSLRKQTLAPTAMEAMSADQRELLLRAGRVLEELAKRKESWNMLNPLKSLAAFARIYKPTEVNLEKLQQEYEQIMSGLEAAPDLASVVDSLKASPQASAQELPQPATVGVGKDADFPPAIVHTAPPTTFLDLPAPQPPVAKGQPSIPPPPPTSMSNLPPLNIPPLICKKCGKTGHPSGSCATSATVDSEV